MSRLLLVLAIRRDIDDGRSIPQLRLSLPLPRDDLRFELLLPQRLAFAIIAVGLVLKPQGHRIVDALTRGDAATPAAR